MFPALKREVTSQFVEIEEFLRVTGQLPHGHATMAKGLMFVQIYAVYEYTINRTVSDAIEAIKAHNHELKEISPSLLTLFLDS